MYDSNAMAALTCASPNSSAKHSPRSAARTPASIPRMRSARTMVLAACRSVAGEAEQVARVVDPLVDGGAAGERHRALLGTYDVEQEEQDYAGEHGPGEPFAD